MVSVVELKFSASRISFAGTWTQLSITVVPMVVSIDAKRMCTLDFCPGCVQTISTSFNNTQNNMMRKLNSPNPKYWVKVLNGVQRSWFLFNFKIEHSWVKVESVWTGLKVGQKLLFHFMCFNLCVSIYVFQFMCFNLYVSIYVFQFMCFNLCVSIYVFQFMCFNLCVSI